MSKIKDKYIFYQVATIINVPHFVESSEQMESQRFSEELFLRIPRKEFGGEGKFGR